MPISESAIQEKLSSGNMDFTVHAVFEAAEDLLFIDEIEDAVMKADIIEDDAERGRCLVCGSIGRGRLVHVVIDYSDWLRDPDAHLVVVTVYRPDPDLWIDGRVRKN